MDVKFVLKYDGWWCMDSEVAAVWNYVWELLVFSITYVLAVPL